MSIIAIMPASEINTFMHEYCEVFCPGNIHQIATITAAIWIGYGSWLLFDPKGLMYEGFALSV